ncbi:MAG TPA: hypothetical protein VNK96_08055 [Fimbriimonadales bacterium]|nr:hypothetical protein [Fimbriimonadales bacterium]
MKLLFAFIGAVIASVVIVPVVINWLVLPREASAQERTLTLSGTVKGESVPDGYAELAFNFYDKDTEVLAYRTVSTAAIQDGSYTASLPADGLTEGKEYYVLVTLPNRVPASLQQENRDAIGVVLLQSETPGIQQTGHVNISGTLIAGAIKTNAFQMPTGASAGRVLTSDGSGNGTWQALPPPSGTAGGDLLGTYPNPLVDGLQGKAVASTAPSAGQVLKWTGSAWSPDADLRDAFWQATGNHIFYNAGNVGIGTSNPFYPLHVHSATSSIAIYVLQSANSGDTYGVVGQSYSTSGRGVVGSATAGSGTTYGVYGLNSSTSGYGVYGLATATSGSNTGVYGWSQSTNGTGVYGRASANNGSTQGVFGISASTNGKGVYGWATATSGTAYGVHGRSDSTTGIGVIGWASATGGNDYKIGVYGLADDYWGIGVYGLANSLVGTEATGVFGRSNASFGIGVEGRVPDTGNVNVGVMGVNEGEAGFGLYSLGRFGASGTKSFQIDHPLSPDTHYLNHFCTEGPEPYNAYSGNVVTDARGYATVQLPDYFESINRDFRYQLTVLDDGEREDFVLVKVVRKIRNNQFTIRSSAPNTEVSWRVEAIRNDLWVQKHGFKTKQEKPEEHKGKYLHPELYGMPKEYEIHYDHRMEQNGRELEASRVSESLRASALNLRRVSSQKKR